jgi:carboxymethylenebutenolidase
MPLYRSDHVEYNIESGHIQIIKDDGSSLPAYWAHPARGTRFPGVALIHNWWGITDVVRRMAHLFAQMGYYVVIPDLFNGVHPASHTEALAQVQKLGEGGFMGIDAALGVLESHHMCNSQVAAVGIGMGGSLAFEAAIKCDDLEVAVAFYGYPQKYFGQFSRANTPVLAVYGDQDPFIKPVVVQKLRDELAATPLKDQHKVVTIAGAGHDFIVDTPDQEQRLLIGKAWQHGLDFIETYIKPPDSPYKRKRY